jgi:hypothetical protein
MNINVAVSIDLMTNLGPLTSAQLSTSAWSATTGEGFSRWWQNGRHCEERSDEAIHGSALPRGVWIASWSLSSGAHFPRPVGSQ